jgi:hypothetical protein
MSESDAAPVGTAFVEVFLGGAELVAGAELEAEFGAGELVGALGAIVDLLAAGLAGAEFDAGAAICESLAAVDFFVLLLLVVVPASLLALAVLLAAAPPVAGAASDASVLFLLRLFFVVVLESALVLAA